MAAEEQQEQQAHAGAGEQTGDLAVFSDLDRQMGELRAFDASRSFDYRDPDDNKAARSHVYQLRRTKTAVDSARKAATKPLRDRIDAINAEGKRLVGELSALIEPHAREIERVEREEQERQERLQSAVDRLREWPHTERDAGAERLRELQAEAEALVIDEAEWGDYAAPAENARAKAAQLFAFRADQAARAEKAEAERERERQERERERQEREAEQAELEQLRREKAEREEAERREREAAEAAAGPHPVAPGDEPVVEGVTGDAEDAEACYDHPNDAPADNGPCVGQAEAAAESAMDTATEELAEEIGDAAMAARAVTAIRAGRISHITFSVEG